MDIRDYKKGKAFDNEQIVKNINLALKDNNMY